MKTLVRNSNTPRPIGFTSELYRSQFTDIQKGETVEIVNNSNEPLNIAKVIKVEADKMQIKIIA